jgi:hypothetical protein
MEEEINKMFRGQRNLLLISALFLFMTMFILTGFVPIVKGDKVDDNLSWEKMYYEMKKQRDSMEVERDDLEKKFEESVRYWQQCESKLNK